MSLRAQAVAAALGVSAAVAPVGDGLDGLRESAALALAVGLDHDEAVVAVAVAVPESGSSDDAVGDTSITDDTWGPSYGRWQIRCLWEERGTGSARDCDRLADPAANAEAMFVVSGGGENWQPWTAYTSGAYRAHLADAERAVTDVERSAPPTGKERTPGRLLDGLWGLSVDGWLRVGQLAGVAPAGRRAWEAVDDRLFGVAAVTVAVREDRLDPEFGAALDRMIADAPGPVTIVSGFRTPAEQADLYRRWQAGDGNLAAWSDGVTCASDHCRGLAVDLAYSSPVVESWFHENARRYSSGYPVSSEPWHLAWVGRSPA